MPSKGYTTPGSRRISVFDPELSPTYSSNLWADCPLQEYLHDPSIGTYLNETFQSYNAASTTGDWVLTQASTGAAAISTADTGVLELDSNSTTVTQGANLQRVKSVFVPAAGRKLWFEVSFKIVDTFDKAEIFAGLSDVDTGIIGSSANASDNHIGWQCVTDDGVLLFTAEKGGTGATKAAATIAEATYIKLGFKLDGISECQQYINGVPVGTPHATANIPIVALVPSLVCQSGGTNDPIMHAKGLRVFQTR